MLDKQIKVGDLIHIKLSRAVCFWSTRSMINLAGIFNEGCNYAIVSLSQIKEVPCDFSLNNRFYFYFYYNENVYYILDSDLDALTLVGKNDQLQYR